MLDPTASATSDALTAVTLDNGLTVIIEPIPARASVALTWLVRGGCAYDADDENGLAALLSEMIFRGAGDLDSREHSDALDRLGVIRSSHTLTHHIKIKATMLGDRLADALPLLIDMVRRPKLSEESLEPARRLCLQSLASLNDDPQHQVMLELNHAHLPSPFNRHGYGTAECLSAATIEQVRGAWRKRFTPHGSILAVAGDVDPQRLLDELNSHFEGWTGRVDEPTRTAEAKRGTNAIQRETAQVHLGLAFDAPREADDDSLLERVAVNVLSGSSSGRLFTEVRQKRSLCYSVGASYQSGRDWGQVTVYAGTTPQRAQETLDVCLSEIDRLSGGAREDEFHRAVVGLKSRLVMQGESTGARASSLAYDQFRIGRPRTLDEIAGAVDAVTFDDLNTYLGRRAVGEVTTCSIGPVTLTNRP